MGCAEGLAPCLIGEFSALFAMRLGKFPNKLRYFLPVNTRAPSVPACLLCPPCLPALHTSQCEHRVGSPSALQPSQTPLVVFPFRRRLPGRSFPFAEALLRGAVGCKVHGKNTTRSMRVEIVPMTALPLDLAADTEAHATFASENGNDCSGCSKWELSLLSHFPARLMTDENPMI